MKTKRTTVQKKIRKQSPDFNPGQVSLAVVACGVSLLTLIALLTTSSF